MIGKRNVLPDDIAFLQKLRQLIAGWPCFSFVRALCIGTQQHQRSSLIEINEVVVFFLFHAVLMLVWTQPYSFPSSIWEKLQLHYLGNGSFDVTFPSFLKHCWQLHWMFTYQRTYEFKMNVNSNISTLIKSSRCHDESKFCIKNSSGVW